MSGSPVRPDRAVPDPGGLASGRPRPAAPGPEPIGLGTTLLYSCGNFGAGIFYSFNNFIMSAFLLPLGISGIVYGLLANQRSFEGTIIQPIVGARSDRTWTRLGRRRPFILAFLPLSILFLAVTPFTPSLGFLGRPLGWSDGFTRAALAALAVFLFSMTFNVQIDPYNTLLADLTPVRQRATVNGLFQAIGAVGQAAIVFATIALVGRIGVSAFFFVVAGALAVFFLPTLLFIREPRELSGVGIPHRYTVRQYWAGLRADRQVQLYFATQFFLWFGIDVITPFLVPYGREALGLSFSGALDLVLVLLLTSSVFCWPLGKLADRLGLKRVFFVGMLALAAASVAGIFLRDVGVLYVVLAIGGLGNAAQTASSYPLMTRLVAADQMGLYTGLNSAVTSFAAPIAGIVGGGLFTGVGPQSMFPLIAGLFLLSLIPLYFIRLDPEAASSMTEASEMGG